MSSKRVSMGDEDLIARGDDYDAASSYKNLAPAEHLQKVSSWTYRTTLSRGTSVEDALEALDDELASGIRMGDRCRCPFGLPEPVYKAALCGFHSFD